MKAPMSQTIRAILSDEKKSKTLSAQILAANRVGATPVLKINGKKVRLVRVSPHTKTK